MAGVSIITVNFNQVDATLDLLASLRLYAAGSEVIVVDNGSSLNPQNKILALFPEVKFIRSDKNLGFAGGNNLGIQRATGEYLLFLNNDTVITEGFIDCMITLFKSNPDAGAMSPVIAYAQSPEDIQYAGYTSVNRITGRNRTITSIPPHPVPTAYLHGAAMMVRKEVIESAGLMPEVYFLYYEELDWSEQIRLAGYGLMLAPCGPVLHKDSLSTGRSSTLKTYYLFRNRVIFMRRNSSAPLLQLFYLYFGGIVFPLHSIKFLLQFKLSHVRALIRGVWWNLTNSVR